MNTQFRRLGRVIAGGAFSLGLAACPLMSATTAMAQVAIVSPSAPTNPHDAAVAAAAKGDYIGALALAKQAAAAGQPLDADQIDFMTGKAAKQQAQLDEDAKVKAKQVAASATAQEILDRQQKEYAARQKQITQACKPQSSSSATHTVGTFTSAAGAAGSTGAGSGFGAKVSGADSEFQKCAG